MREDPRAGTTGWRADYLVGGLRISLGPDSTTPGPRSHIIHFTDALSNAGAEVELYLASSFPGLGSFARLREGSTAKASRVRLVIGDLLRLGVGLWCGACTWVKSLGSRPTVIYERVAVVQSMTSFHARKSHAVRVVECNGIMSVETSRDRNALALEGLARRIERHVYRSADLVVAVSDLLADAVVSFAQIPRAKVLVIPNAIPSELLSIQLVASDTPVVGFIGSVVDWQRLDLLIDALKHCERIDWTAEILGDGPALDGLKARAQELGMADRVTFFGRVPQSEAFAVMSRWSIGYSGHGESSGHAMYHSPLKLYEYAGLGLSALSSPSEDARSLTADGMKIYPFDSPLELVSALRSALEDNADLESRARTRKKLAELHSWDARASTVIRASRSIR